MEDPNRRALAITADQCRAAREALGLSQAELAGVAGPSRSFDKIVILTLRGGKVVHQAGVVDNLSALRQFDVLSTPRVETAPALRRNPDQMRSVEPEDEDRAGPEAPKDQPGSDSRNG